MAGLLAKRVDVARTRGSIYTRRVHESRGASHTTHALTLTSTDRLNNQRGRRAAAACSGPPQPMRLASAARPAAIGRRHSSLPGRIHRFAHQSVRKASCRRPLRPASTATAAANLGSSRPGPAHREPVAQAAQSGAKAAASANPFEAALDSAQVAAMV